MEELPLFPGQHTRRWAQVADEQGSSGAQAAPGLGFASPSSRTTPAQGLGKHLETPTGESRCEHGCPGPQPPRRGWRGSAQACTCRCLPAPRPPPLLTSPRAAAFPGAGRCPAPPQLSPAPAVSGPARRPQRGRAPVPRTTEPSSPGPAGHGRAELRHCRARPRGGLRRRRRRALRRSRPERSRDSPQGRAGPSPWPGGSRP